MRFFSPLMMFWRTLVAMESVFLRSASLPDVHTHRNGPKPREKMSLEASPLHSSWYS